MLWKERFIIDNPMISYINGTNGEKKGVLLAGVHKNEVCFGWSLCKTSNNYDKKDTDVFDRDKGVFEIAQGRALKNDRMYYNFKFERDIPLSVWDNVEKFTDRIDKYYKRTDYSNLLAEVFANVGG